MKKFAFLFLFQIFCGLFMITQHLVGQGLVAVNDTVDITPGFPVTVDLLANDTIPAGDSVRVVFTAPYLSIIQTTISSDLRTCTFLLNYRGFGGTHLRGYKVFDFTTGVSSPPALVVFHIHDRSNAYLDINNVKALFSSSGLHFFKDSAQYEVPKGSGKTSLFSNSVWIGGIDPGHTLHFAGERYRQGTGNMANTQHDFWAGPVGDTTSYNSIQDTIWNRVWNIHKAEIDYHRVHYWETGYVPPKDILEWPAHGDVSIGQAANLAPFSDRNGNGKYEPYDGDYPEIRGDQALFFIYNDDHGYHAESTGYKLKVEIHGMAYAFDKPDDTAFKNTTFLHLKFFNRSNYNYADSWLGIFTDIDLGYANDDYIGCDPERGMYFGYNGTPVDGTGQSYAYGENPPIQAVVILGGPLMDQDGYDNPSFRGSSLYGPSFKGSCDIVAQNGSIQVMKYGPGEIYEASFLVRDEAINGINFGDGITDNERLGMRRFLYHNNSNAGVPAYMSDPVYADDYYRAMNGIWKDNTKMIYGGNGHALSGGYGPECEFMFPGISDTCNWGTNGQFPNGLKEWTEKTAMNNPQDRRGTGSTGPFTFNAGTSQELDLAFAWARCYNQADSTCAMQKINAVVDTIRSSFIRNSLPGGGMIYGIHQPWQEETLFKIYPNPANHLVVICPANRILGNVTCEIRNQQGVLVKVIHGFLAAGENREIRIETTNLPKGIYLVKISSDTVNFKQKLIITH
jgi:hypothetical protein